MKTLQIRSLAVVLLLAATVVGCKTEDKMMFKKGELFYVKKEGTEANAKKIGQALADKGMFSDKRETSAKFLKPDSISQLLLVMNTNASDTEVIDEIQQMAMDLSEQQLGGAPLDVVLTDSTWKPFYTERYRSLGKLMPVGPSYVFYTNNVSQDVAQNATPMFEEAGFKEAKKIGQLDKNASGYVFNLFSDNKPDAATSDILRSAMARWSREKFGGVPLTLRLCDIHMQPFATIAPNS